ncbi:tRNA pseudouridine synthase A [Candidatus Kinetoplastibacterium sorsogonicusi]|uniref:tRNA pseudouridine synthase A n=1 Tax=Candidatus Kinetoplastidibacterium kentomonadis TaxID=1576550 RepID=A0A3S7J9I7_9PROT|nr:tRNA pseudouridine(38-40) synthase TruA [Candidatus Kinetoplastibacterium sorsogonicusi]AWD32338.1 tRNA pseudouridine synthase A [Candidatus Kinetoplastibacterium sorsogonicusi]
MNRIVMGISYDGSKWLGWQTQKHKNTVQDVLEYAISKFISSSCEHKVSIICAGRTDAGVHAIIQVIHFDTIINRDMKSWIRGTNAFLPSSISVLWARNLSFEFHSRFSAIARNYTYILYRGKIRPSILYKKVGWTFKDININKLHNLSKNILGTHNFNNFRSSGCQSKNPIKTIYDFNIYEYGSFIIFNIKGNAFLYHMVRNIIGALLQVASDKKNEDWFINLINDPYNKKPICTFSPYGLYLSSIIYPDKFNLQESRIENNNLFSIFKFQ